MGYFVFCHVFKCFVTCSNFLSRVQIFCHVFKCFLTCSNVLYLFLLMFQDWCLHVCCSCPYDGCLCIHIIVCINVCLGACMFW